ncbi:MAG TPA: hypothetical protein VEL31_21555 [Ktedonobacteraceae bacterium]|nr:hypothetical protein [Ktedonobacteraceae bacterium]
MPDEQLVQLNVWIAKDLKDYLADRAKRDNKQGMNVVVADLIRQERAREQGEVVEQQSLPVLQEMMRHEIRQALADHRREVRDDRALELDEQRDYLRKGFDRMAALIVHAIRNAGIGRRLAYAVLAKAHGTSFAQNVFEDAKEKTQRELAPKAQHEEVQA